jgi:endonuclease/exonuclease/phosphatase family metal-dependent hydrolase
METGRLFRIASYNLHKCRGVDGRVVPARIIDVIQELDADILCLQEVVNAPEYRSPIKGRRMFDQAGDIARSLPGYAWAFGANRPLHGGTYGNMTLTRLALRRWHNHDVSRPRKGREERGVLESEIELDSGMSLRVFNIHLGTGFMERRYQARKLARDEVFAESEGSGPRIVIGDFNEWTRGLTTRMLRKRFQSIRPRHALRFPRTYPGLLPLLSLDHCYYEPPLQLAATRLWRSRRALIASDHLPLIADFREGTESTAPPSL